MPTSSQTEGFQSLSPCSLYFGTRCRQTTWIIESSWSLTASSSEPTRAEFREKNPMKSQNMESQVSSIKYAQKTSLEMLIWCIEYMIYIYILIYIYIDVGFSDFWDKVFLRMLPPAGFLGKKMASRDVRCLVLFYCSHVVSEDMEIMVVRTDSVAKEQDSNSKRSKGIKGSNDPMISHRVHLCNSCRSSGLSQW